jgi:hypothetical protein
MRVAVLVLVSEDGKDITARRDDAARATAPGAAYLRRRYCGNDDARQRVSRPALVDMMGTDAALERRNLRHRSAR